MSAGRSALLLSLAIAVLAAPGARGQTVSAAVRSGAAAPVRGWRAPAGQALAPASPAGPMALAPLPAGPLLPGLPGVPLGVPVLDAAPAPADAAAPVLPVLALAAEAAPRAAAPTRPAPASQARLAPDDLKAGAAGRVAGMASEVSSVLGAAGDLAALPAEEGAGAADRAFRALTRERDPADASLAAEPLAPAPGRAEPTLAQQKMVATLYKIASVYAEQYAPIEWKKERFQVNLKREYEKARAAILADPGITVPRFQSLLSDFAAALRDYHVAIGFYSTEKARLPLRLMGANGKVFIAFINREKLPGETFPFREGDEVLEFDGKPVAEAVRALAGARTGNVAGTDIRFAEMMLTSRSRAMGYEVPRGAARMRIRNRAGKVFDVEMPWDYTPEKIPNAPVRDGGLDLPVEPAAPEAADALAAGPQAWSRPLAEAGGAVQRGLSRLFTRAAHPFARAAADLAAKSPENPFTLGGKKSFIPRLGDIVWQAKADNPFHAYIFTDKKGRRLGYVRIADYGGDRDEIEAFGRLMARFQKETEGLVIDQVNNPGGSLFTLYALASRLTDKPMASPKHRLLIDESDAAWALETLEKLEDPAQAEDAIEELEDEWTTHEVDDTFVGLMIKFAKFILAELSAGRRLTGPTHLWGVDEILPAPAGQRYTKPILLLVNELDFSGGDFFPAIMQDNGRATVMGVRTSGAGGAVRSFSLPNQFGVESVDATWTLAQRKNGAPLENLGVAPDVPYELTERDLKTGFAPYRRAILKALESLLAGR